MRRVERRREVVQSVADDLVVLPDTDHATRASRDPAAEVGSLAYALEVVGTLPTDMAEAIMLRVIYELSVSEVAEIMDRSEGSVRVLVHRGLTRLHGTLTRNEVIGRDRTTGSRAAAF